MPRLILIITSILCLGGIGLGFVNRGKFISVRNEKDTVNRQIDDAISQSDQLVNDIKATHKDSNDVEAELEKARVATFEAERKLKGVDTEMAQHDQGIASAKNQIEEIRGILAPFEGVTPETVNQDLADMEQEIETMREDIAGLEDIIKVAQGVVEKNRAALVGYREAQTKRTQAIALQATEATITAVNSDYGFVLVNAGSNKGVPTDAELLIRRGSEQIGKLSIVDIQPNLLVANIVQDSLRPGVSVMPGDRVVFDANVN